MRCLSSQISGMDKDSVLTRVLNSGGLSTLVGGKLPVSVMNSSQYVSPLTAGAQAADENGGNSLLSVDQAILNALCADIKTAVLVGPEGSGKTTALEKLVVDWAKGEHLQTFACVFYFRMKEINSLEVSCSLESLLQQHLGRIPPGSMPRLLQRPEDLLFVFDDLHQYRHSLDPTAHALCLDPFRAAPASCLVASLLHGSLLKGAAFVLATRPSKCLDFLSGTTVELLGFQKPQRRAYFNGFFTDPANANKALMHMERTLGFYDFCASPRFCWTVCSVYKSLMDAGRELPETLSQLCVDILVSIIKDLSLKKSSIKELVLALGRMASHLCLHSHSSCTKEEMDSFGLQQFDFSSIVVFVKVDCDTEQEACVFSFHSRLLLELILAVSFFLDESVSEGVEEMLEKHKEQAELLEAFLSGLSEPGQRASLETLLGEFNSDQILSFKHGFKSSTETTLKGWSKEMHFHCFHCLYQTQNKRLVKEVIASSSLRGISYGGLSLRDCVALNYVVSCLGEIKELNLYGARNLTEEQAEVLAPTMSMSHKINLSSSSLNTGALSHLASSLSKGIATELDLSHTDLGDEKFKILTAGLRDSKLCRLNLLACNLTHCEDLRSVLTSVTSQLCVLKMKCNPIGDQGFIQLCKSLHSSHCKLQELWLQGCRITAASMEAFSAALCSGKSELRKVDLMQNAVGDSGVKALCASLQHPLCKLQSLVLFDNELTGACCPHLMQALMSEHCSLAELDLSVNDLGQEGALLLCQSLGRPRCPIEKLGLKRCELTQSVFKELGLVLKSRTRLRSLIVGINKVGDQGVKHLWEAIAHPDCLLEELDVEMTDLTDACVEDLCAAISASKTLKSLELRNNSLTDASVPALVRVMHNSHYMQEMNLKYNDFSEDMFDLLDECQKIRY